MIPCLKLKANESGVGTIHEQVGDQEPDQRKQSAQQKDRIHDRKVACIDRFVDRESHPRNSKDGLNDDGTSDCCREGEAKKCEGLDPGVAKRVDVEGFFLIESFCKRGLEIIGLHFSEKCLSELTGEKCPTAIAIGYSRQDEVGNRAVQS